MDNEEIQGVKFSEFQSATPDNADEVVGLHSGNNARFSVANFILAIRQGLTNLFVPTSRTVNGIALSSDITLDASDVGAVDADDVGVADGVASLDSTGKVPSSQLPPISSDADDITYDPTSSGLSAANVQDAIDEVVTDLDGKQAEITASGILKGDGQGGVSAATAGTDYGTYSKPSGGIPASDLASGVIPTVPSISTSTPNMDGTGAAGSTGQVSDAGHVHPKEPFGEYDALLSDIQSLVGVPNPHTVPSLSQYRYLLVTMDYKLGAASRNVIVSNMMPISLFTSGVGCQVEFYDGSTRHYYVIQHFSNTQVSISSPTNITGNFTGYVFGIK